MVAAKVRRVVFAGSLARQMLLTLVPDPLRWSVGAPHADSGELLPCS